MGRIAAIRPGHHVAAESRRPAWPAVTTGATVGKSRTECEVSVNLARAVRTGERPLALYAQELALEKLSPAPNRTEGIAGDDERGRIRCLPITAPGAHFLRE